MSSTSRERTIIRALGLVSDACEEVEAVLKELPEPERASAMDVMGDLTHARRQLRALALFIAAGPG